MTNGRLRSAHSVADFVLCAVQNGLTQANSAPIQRTYVAAGAIAWDDCCGMLVTAPERIYRSISFPAEFAEREICDLGWLNIDLLVLLVRCVPVVDNMGRAPTSDALNEAYKETLADSAVIWNVLQCLAMPDDWEKASLSQAFIGADGGCVGIESRITIGIPQTRWGA